MYYFIEEIKDKTKRRELIIEQNGINFNNYFKKNLGEYLNYYQRVGQKCCLKIITPQQSIFSVVGSSHEKTCNSILDTAFNGNFQRKEGEKTLNDTENNMNLGNIYIKMYDCDVSTQKKGFLKRLFSDSWSNVLVMVPKNFNQYQIDELRKTIKEISKYDNNFKTQDIGIMHYLDYELNDKICYENEEIQKFLDETNGDANKYIKEVEINPNEEVIVETNKYKKPNANNNRNKFLEDIHTENQSTTTNNKKEKIGNSLENNKDSSIQK